jgi:hypothetical protein
MRNLSHDAALDGAEAGSDPELRSEAAAILQRMARCAYVREQHQLAIARITHEIAQLQTELERLEGGVNQDHAHGPSNTPPAVR